ncbi:hypothetical protein PLIP_b0059 [Pseudoalteromonas lipolytica LMEB 39]|nr:hypothetical protein [Pseudoalteromonas lipolytica LMEB 39]
MTFKTFITMRLSKTNFKKLARKKGHLITNAPFLINFY